MKNTNKILGIIGGKDAAVSNAKCSFATAKLQGLKITGMLFLILIIGLLASCGGGLNGSYSLQGGGDLTYNFMSGGKIIMESDGKVLGEGTFKTSGGKLTITGSEGVQTIDYKLEGKNLIFSMGDQSMTFAKK
jgi:hypothetical protein